MRLLDESVGRSRESMATSSTSITLEEERGVRKSGTLNGGYVPIQSKKKSYYVVLGERAIELYESEKAYRKPKKDKKPDIIDLSTAFNVSNDHMDAKLRKCVCIMLPGETVVLKAETDSLNAEWYEAILSEVISSRAYKLKRCVLPKEFFECAYDVSIVQTPKSTQKKQEKDGEEHPNFLKKMSDFAGPHRLCFHTHTIVLCKRKIEAVAEEKDDGLPFKSGDFLELQRTFIPFFICQEKYFIVRMGRGSPMGQCEVWAQCDSPEVAAHLHLQLNAIIDRVTQQRVNGMPQIMPQMTLPHRRDRAHTSASNRHRLGTTSTNGGSYSDVPARERRWQLRESKARLDSFEEELCGRQGSSTTTPSPSLALDLASRRHTQSPLSHLGRKSSMETPSSLGPQRHSIAATLSSTSSSSTLTGQERGSQSVVFPPNRRTSETIKEESTLYQLMEAVGNKVEKEIKKEGIRKKGSCASLGGISYESQWNGMPLLPQFRGGPPSPSPVSAEETEDSGGTLRLGSGSKNATPSSSIKNLNIIETRAETHVYRQELSSEEDGDDVLSAGTTASTGGSLSNTDDITSYAHMDAADWSGESCTHLAVPYEKYTLDEARSYVSSSSDSCYSSMAVPGCTSTPSQSATLPNQGSNHNYRTHSFCGQMSALSVLRPKGTASPPTDVRISYGGKLKEESGLENDEYCGGIERIAPLVSQDAARQRAFSLGSRSFLALSRPFRKLSQHSRSRHTATPTSVSGVSLASSGVSSSGIVPTGMSFNPLTSLPSSSIGDKDEYHRNRSGSFGSGRSTPHSRRSNNVDKSRDHLVEMDFGGQGGHHGLGRCGSGSIGSVDSPSRSRTSSFGCQMKKEIESSEIGSELEGIGLTPSQVVLQKAKQLSVDEVTIDHSDYVVTDIVNPSSICPFPPPSDDIDIPSKMHDSRSSHFETIEESASGMNNGEWIMEEEEEEDEYTVMEVGKEGDMCRSRSSSPLTSHQSGDTTQRKCSAPTKHEGNEGSTLLTTPTVLPKRSSVPLLKDDQKEDNSTLNYAFLDSSRSTSKSTILLSTEVKKEEDVEYSVLKPC